MSFQIEENMLIEEFDEQNILVDSLDLYYACISVMHDPKLNYIKEASFTAKGGRIETITIEVGGEPITIKGQNGRDPLAMMVDGENYIVKHQGVHAPIFLMKDLDSSAFLETERKFRKEWDVKTIGDFISAGAEVAPYVRERFKGVQVYIDGLLENLPENHQVRFLLDNIHRFSTEAWEAELSRIHDPDIDLAMVNYFRIMSKKSILK